MKSLILALFLFLGTAQAAEITREQGVTLYMLAHSISHIPLPETDPELVLMDREKLVKEICRGKPCLAAQVENRIYMDKDMDMQDKKNAAIVFHELVHFLQWARSGPAKTCAEWIDREILAFQLQNEVLYKSGETTVVPPTTLQMTGACNGKK